MKRLGLLLGSAVAAVTAAQAQEDQSSFDTIVVTAQKREQNLQDVPVAVSAFSQQSLDLARVTDVSSLARLAPSLQFGDNVTSRSRANFIRGLGTQSFSDGVETGVGTFVDGVILGRDFQGFGLFDDVERVEVLRGPQGTLFGKNTSAGVIHLITADPKFNFEARGSVAFASDNETILRGMVNVPLTDNLAVRVTAYDQQRDGIVEDAINGGDADDDQGRGVRAKVLWEPTETFSARFSADYQESDEECCNILFRNLTPPDPASPTPFLTAFGALQIAGFDPTVIDEDNRTSFSNTPTGEETENYGASLQLDWDLGAVKLVSISAYREGNIFEFNGADFGPLTVLDVASTDSETEQFTQELRLESADPDARLQYVAGFYYFDQDVNSTQRFEGVDLITFGLASAGLAALPPVPPQEQTTLHGASYDNWALFGQGTYALTDRFRLTAGLRYTSDEVSGFVDRQSSILLNSPPVGLVPIFGDGSFEADTEEDNLGYRFIGEVDLTPSIMTYVSYARGYKGPAIQVDPLFRAGASLPVVDPEIPTSLEFGLRSQFWDNRVTFNATAFRTEVEDYQAAAFDPSALSFLLQNVGDVVSQGLEIESFFEVTDSLRLTGNFTFLDAEIDSFEGASCYVGQTEAEGCVGGIQDLSGGDLPFAADTSFYLGADYLFNLSSRIFGTAHVGYAYTGDTQFSLNNNPDTVQEAYGLLDAQLQLTLDDRYTFALFGTNLTDETFSSFIASTPVYSSFFGDPSTSHVAARGRVIGVRLQAEF
ncbi:MAG: TonB-dependent receptor [Pseudomonadota bacterium]